jgi:uncharacterized protein YcbK (DUF882 family)
MTNNDWKKIVNFSKNENWGDPEKMSIVIVGLLDQFRAYTCKKMIVTSGTQGTHAKNSAHYQGLAVDIVFPELTPKNIPDMFIDASRFNFKSIGIYPHWKYNGVVVGGMHVDHVFARNKRYWIGLPDGVYVDLNTENINKYFLSGA